MFYQISSHGLAREVEKWPVRTCHLQWVRGKIFQLMHGFLGKFVGPLPSPLTSFNPSPLTSPTSTFLSGKTLVGENKVPLGSVSEHGGFHGGRNSEIQITSILKNTFSHWISKFTIFMDLLRVNAEWIRQNSTVRF